MAAILYLSKMTDPNVEETCDRFTQLEELINRRFDLLQHSNDQTNNTLATRKAAFVELARENRELHNHVRTLENRLLKLEKQVNNTEQNNRKNNIEIDGIPASVDDEDLRGVVARLLNHLAYSDITVADIEASHRLYSKTTPHPTIVRLKRNLIEEVKSKEAKAKLKDIALKMSFPRGTRIYINDNQSPNMRSLAYNARLLKNSGLISDTWFSNAAVRIKRTPDSRTLKITHEKDLVDAFPAFDEFTFDMHFYRRLQDEEDLEEYHDIGGISEEDVRYKINKQCTTPPTESEIAAIRATIAAAEQKYGGGGSGYVVEEHINPSGGVPTKEDILDKSGGGKGTIDEGKAFGETSGPSDGVMDGKGASLDVDPNLTPPGEHSPNGGELNLLDPKILQRNNKVTPGTKSPTVNPHITRSTTKHLAHALFMGN